MPAIPKSSLVLVTGATGFIAVWVVKLLLEAGYRVRGTARSGSKAAYLERLFLKEKGDGKFEMVIVEDITANKAFDDAVKGVDAVAHIASPFRLNADDPQELIAPAVQGTVGVLQSVLKHSRTTRRIIVLSSTAAIFQEPPPGGIVLSEKDWNNVSIEDVEANGKNALQVNKYKASKSLAEKAAWRFYAENKSKIEWDLVALNPPFVFGPTLHEVSDISSLNTSSATFFNLLCTPETESRTQEDLLQDSTSWVDVRDVASAHIRALEVEEAGGERFLISAGEFVWQDWLDAAHRLSVSPAKLANIAKGFPGGGEKARHPLRHDTSKSASVLGFGRYRTREETVEASLEDFEKRGWW